MRHIKLFFAAVALMLASSTFAGTYSNLEPERSSVTYEIQKMLKDSNLAIEEEFVVRVIFKLDEKNRISIHSINSPYEEVNAFLEKRLNNQKLHGEGWLSEKVYILPVKVMGRR